MKLGLRRETVKSTDGIRVSKYKYHLKGKCSEPIKIYFYIIP